MPALESRQTGEVTIVAADGASGTIALGTSVVMANAFVTFSFESADLEWRDFRHAMYVELTDVNELTWVRDTGVNSKDITLRWWVVESTAFTVQRGTLTAINGTNAITTLADVNKSFLISAVHLSFNIIYYNGAQCVRGEITSTTNLALTSSGTPTAGFAFHYQIVECDDISVKRGTIDITTTDSSNTGAISAVDVDKSFILINGHEDGLATTAIKKETRRVELTSSTVVTAFRGVQDSSSSTDTIGYEVVEFTDDSVVYNGQLTISDTNLSATSSAFSPKPAEADTIPMMSGHWAQNVVHDSSSDAPDSCQGLVSLDVTTGEVDSVTITRNDNANAATYFYNVVEFVGGGGGGPSVVPKVQHHARRRR